MHADSIIGTGGLAMKFVATILPIVLASLPATCQTSQTAQGNKGQVQSQRPAALPTYSPTIGAKEAWATLCIAWKKGLADGRNHVPVDHCPSHLGEVKAGARGDFPLHTGASTIAGGSS